MSVSMMYTAISGLDTFNEALTLVSNNIANANTTAFKSEEMDFGNLVSGYMPTVYGNDETSPGAGSAILSTSADQTEGTEMQTGLWSDMMVQGQGYFQVEDPTSNDTFYTRDGSFEVNSADQLTNANGDEVLDTSGNAIDLTPAAGTTYASYSVDKYGNISGVEPDGTTVSIDQIGLTTFSNPSGLVSQGNNLFTTSSNSGTSVLGAAGTGQAGTLISGALEGSNVDLTTQMVNLINFQADYQANSKSISTGNTVLQTAVNLIAG